MLVVIGDPTVNPAPDTLALDAGAATNSCGRTNLGGSSIRVNGPYTIWYKASIV